MAYVQPGDISAILNAFGQLGQSNALIRQRKDQAAAERAGTMGAIGGLAGGIGAGLISGGNPYAAMAGSAAGSQLLSGGRTSGSQTINQAGQAYQMATSQQAHEQQQADRAAVTRAGEMLNPAPVASGPMLGDEMQGTPTQAITQPEPNVRGAIGELFRGGQVGPAISLMAAQQKQGGEAFTLGKDQTRYDATGKVIADKSAGGGMAGPPMLAGEDAVKQANVLRKEFIDGAKEFKVVNSSYNTVQSAVKAGTAQGDIASVYAVMKMYDPNSVVRETEYATAKNAAGVPDIIRNTWNKLQDGQFLTPGQRADMLGRATDIYKNRLGEHKQQIGQYQKLAESLEPQYRGQVIVDMIQTSPEQADNILRDFGKISAKPATKGPPPKTTKAGDTIFENLGDQDFSNYTPKNDADAQRWLKEFNRRYGIPDDGAK